MPRNGGAGTAAAATVDEDTAYRVGRGVERGLHCGERAVAVATLLIGERDLEQESPPVIVPLPILGPVRNRGLDEAFLV